MKEWFLFSFSNQDGRGESKGSEANAKLALKVALCNANRNLKENKELPKGHNPVNDMRPFHSLESSLSL